MSDAKVSIQRSGRSGQLGGWARHGDEPFLQHHHALGMGQDGPIVAIHNDRCNPGARNASNP